ncbi:methyltransferase family protein [Marinomonas aquiplantarum]|uniref:Protein-S-isoprenylcysteine O-methyltransferase Ste14 n=1 Tax=Marinomonas aquiplantarum TaxID=491951 RepID=A0A366D1Y5_9GAMM|nr:isoprenylcysteine carboxylmethyltransferase family protein [Marinomonas aquiplantarum]RBO83956.1 protein-S-isoprenylcysteine O-methyltransferase Ste14 [Marinomonas aquiplantarum]
MSKLELRIPPVLLLLICLVGMWVTAVFMPAVSLSFAWAKLVAGGFFLLGGALIILSVVAFRQAKTTLDPRYPEQSSHLVSCGVFGVSRNPIYLGFVLLLIGVAWYLMNLLAVVWIFAFVFYMTRFQIVPEERHMKEKFAEEFDSYSARVRRWF